MIITTANRNLLHEVQLYLHSRQVCQVLLIQVTMHYGSSIKIHRYSNQEWQENYVPELQEQSVTLSINGKNWLTFLCLPEDLEYLAIGFLYTEGIIQGFDEVITTHICDDNSLIDVWLSHSIQRPRKWARTTGCGGGVTRGLKINSHRIIPPTRPIDQNCILTAMDRLYKWQSDTQSARGLHCSALSDGKNILHAARDVGRHNTLDKIAGKYIQNNGKSGFLMALTTGRITSEMLTKCGRIGTAVVISRTSPSNMAIKMAEASGITLIGHVQEDAFNVFSHPEIISGHPVCPIESQGLDLLSACPPRELYPQEY
jgi:FdhD protein